MSNAIITPIDTNEALASACQTLAKSSLLAVDTEFFRETSYFPVPALIQLYAGDQVYLVDCLTISEWQPLRDLFTDQSVTKLLHSCGEDLEVFHQLLGVLPAPLLDSQIAAALAGLDFSMGYQALIRELLGREVDKEQTRSNWLQRPLSAEQQHYAANDVLWLPAAWAELENRLQAEGRLDWCLEDCERLLQEPIPSLVPAEQAYLRIKSAWRLSGLELCALRELCAWREQRARDKDIPRSRVLDDAGLMAIAKALPDSLESLNRLQVLRGKSRSRIADELLAVVAEARACAAADWPAPMLDRSAPAFRDKLKRLKSLVEANAQSLALPPEILGRKRELEKLLENPADSVVAKGWRGALFGDQLERV